MHPDWKGGFPIVNRDVVNCNRRRHCMAARHVRSSISPATKTEVQNGENSSHTGNSYWMAWAPGAPAGAEAGVAPQPQPTTVGLYWRQHQGFFEIPASRRSPWWAPRRSSPARLLRVRVPLFDDPPGAHVRASIGIPGSVLERAAPFSGFKLRARLAAVRARCGQRGWPGVFATLRM